MKFVKIEVFVPREDAKKLMKGINEGGFLEEENYDFCYSETRVIGHFRPITGANPYIGTVGSIEDVEENKNEETIIFKTSDSGVFNETEDTELKEDENDI